MRRRIEDITGRPETSVSNAQPPIVSGTSVGAHGSSSPVSFVRLPTTTPARLSSPVSSIPVSTTAALAIHEQAVQSGYVPGRIEMHPISPFTGNVSAPGSNLSGVIDGSRPLIGTPARGDTSTTTQPSPPIRQRVLSNSGATHQVVSTQVGNAATITGSQVGNAATIAACANLNNQISGQFQRLKVEDALSYLDKVKLRFGRQPQVYNDFLDIMKEFKSQSIDTPGVIARVSQLFRGHPELIVGFNTFLPPGYKIEVQSNEQVSVSVPGQQTTVVHTPQGVHHHFTTTITTPQSTPPLAAAQQPLAATKTEPVMAPSTPRPSVPTLISSGTTIVIPTSPSRSSSPVCTTSPTVQMTSPAPEPSSLNSSSVSIQPPQPPQPVEFNHAISYVNKIKSRFCDQPDIYKQFLDILHTYQKEQKYMKEGGSIPRSLTDAEVYERVAKLFKCESDLLEEFSQFLPDATNNSAEAVVSNIMDQYKNSIAEITNSEQNKSMNKSNDISTSSVIVPSINQPNTSHLNEVVKRGRSIDHCSLPAPKRIRAALRDGSLAEVGKQMTLAEYSFFENVRKALQSQSTYENFVRCIDVYTHGALGKHDLLSLVNPFLSKFPDLHKWLVDFVGAEDAQMPFAENSLLSAKQERIGGDLAMEIDYNTCKRLGASYCALPKSFQQPECSGRNNLCKEVLNDTWVSFPSWSEDSTFVTSKKTQFEEYIYRCEDERFELDMVLETNTATIKLLCHIEKFMEKMSQKDANSFSLDENLNGSAITIYKRAISRVYGEKANDIITGLRKNPFVAVPLVLRRLKSKDEDWREALKGFHKSWHEINDKYYLKSLDPQGISFKQIDMKLLRSKSFINEIETLYDERHERSDAGGRMDTGPHLKLPYADRGVIDDAANLIIHHVRRQTAIHKDDKAKIKQLVRHFIPDLLFHTRLELSDDERDLEDLSDDQMDVDSDSSSKEKAAKIQRIATEGNGNSSNGSTSTNGSCKRTTRSKKCGGGKPVSRQNSSDDTADESLIVNGALDDAHLKPKMEIGENHMDDEDLSDDDYKMFICNNNWYLLLRLHHILCTRLLLMYDTSLKLLAIEIQNRKDRSCSAAMALKLRPQYEVVPEAIYTAMLDMVKNVLDGNLEICTFEDRLREMFGIDAYKAFTLDKVVTTAVRQLQHIVCDEAPSQITSMYIQESRKGATGGPCASGDRRFPQEQLYIKRAEKCLKEENCYKILTYRAASELTMELIDPDAEDSEENGNNSPTNGNKEDKTGVPAVVVSSAEAERLTDYVDEFLSHSPQLSPSVTMSLCKKPVFLGRNIRSCIKKSCISNKHIEDDTQCRFNLSNFKMVFVVNSDSCIFKKAAFYKARKSHKAVSQRMNNAFSKWHLTWCKANVNEEEDKSVNCWFAGESEGLRPNKTFIKKIEAVNKAPYRTFTKYTSD